MLQDGAEELPCDRDREGAEAVATEVTGERKPMVIESYLRPGSYRLVIKLEDSNGKTRQIDFIYKDDGYDAARTIPLVDELIDSEKTFVVWTLGSPNGLELTLSNGIVSGRRDEKGQHYVQTTATISPGSSGGGLFDARSNLIGITTLALIGRDHLNQSLNFAIAADSFWQP